MEVLRLFIVCLLLCCSASADVQITSNQNLSELAIAFSEISQGLQASQTITILNSENRKSSAFNELIMEIHRLQLQTCIFNDTERFFRFVKENLKGSVEVTALIFHKPDSLIQKVTFESLSLVPCGSFEVNLLTETSLNNFKACLSIEIQSYPTRII